MDLEKTITFIQQSKPILDRFTLFIESDYTILNEDQIKAIESDLNTIDKSLKAQPSFNKVVDIVNSVLYVEEEKERIISLYRTTYEFITVAQESYTFLMTINSLGTDPKENYNLYSITSKSNKDAIQKYMKRISIFRKILYYNSVATIPLFFLLLTSLILDSKAGVALCTSLMGLILITTVTATILFRKNIDAKYKIIKNVISNYKFTNKIQNDDIL